VGAFVADAFLVAVFFAAGAFLVAVFFAAVFFAAGALAVGAFLAGAFLAAVFVAADAFLAEVDGLRAMTLRAADAAELASDFLVLRAMNWGLPSSRAPLWREPQCRREGSR
jgi:hypothetical protein